ncbi:MAG: Bacteriophage head to tail connecting protein [Akkermansiaceae bacterium]|nr:Bacteriophage head to tail connecting protein [Akkermansiaceae bacterium]
MSADIEELCERYQALKSDRSTWDSFWQELAETCCPRKAQITTKNQFPNTDKERGLYNSTAVQCNMTLAHGQMSYSMPFSERWFNLEPPADMQSDAAYRYFGKCSEIMATGLATGGFYTEMHEACIDRSAFGPGNLYVEESFTNPSGLSFDAVPVGSYSIAENADKRVDTVYRDKELTAVQLVQQFGDNVPKVVKEAYDDSKKRHSTKFKVVHAVYPRDDRNSMLIDAGNMEYASCWFMPSERHLLREGGYQEMPYLVSRYLKWNNEVYGWCPGWQAMAPARQLNLLERIMDGMAEVALYPRILIPSTLEGEVDMTPGGPTIYNPFQNAKPEEWGGKGRIDAGLERLARREQEIKDAYHYDLFRMFSDIDKQMTAREVMERATEKLVLFSPTFVRMQEEWLNPLLLRVFRIYMKQRRFPPPPPEVVSQDGRGFHIRPPQILFTSRVALAIRSLQSAGFMHLLEALQPMLAIDPTVRHVVKVGEAAQGLGRNFGVPQEWLATVPEYEQAVQAEIQQQQAMAQAEAANQMIGTAAKLKPEQVDAVGKAMRGQAA